ncbi:hypothetical protein NVP1215B_035 [Vibrio phage 1.215.B._10N.222.54.F7]|nr:hypothetical protein NVP1215A_035 [Vibrio phage 1.215.A._10N.222.54.F7]AUR96058.1 hypothetical protein NVP1215B_035 [Vibrio phage 1.215.B._10N.222.54.F7]
MNTTTLTANQLETVLDTLSNKAQGLSKGLHGLLTSFGSWHLTVTETRPVITDVVNPKVPPRQGKHAIADVCLTLNDEGNVQVELKPLLTEGTITIPLTYLRAVNQQMHLANHELDAGLHETVREYGHYKIRVNAPGVRAMAVDLSKEPPHVEAVLTLNSEGELTVQITGKL